MDVRISRPGSARRPLLFGWAPIVAWAALIFLRSAQPNLRFVPDARLDFVVRKIGHMGVFGILALLLWRAMTETAARRRSGAWALLVAGRHPSAFDVGVDAAGALIALVAVGLIQSGRS